MKNLVPTDNTVSQCLGTRLKRWWKAFVTVLVDVDPETGQEVEVAVRDLVTGADISATVALETAAREEAVKGETNARKEALSVETADRIAADKELAEKISGLQGVVTYLDSHNFETDKPSQETLTAYALLKTGWKTVKNSTSVINGFDNHEWIYNTETARWINYGQSTVRVASNERLGIVKGAVETGKVAVLTDGTLRVNGMAPAASPVFTGKPQAPTPATADNSNQIATTKFVKERIAEISDAGSSTKLPVPTVNPGVGQWVAITNAVPAGGTWAYYSLNCLVVKTGSGMQVHDSYYPANPLAGVVPGGTRITTSTAAMGFAWRIA